MVAAWHRMVARLRAVWQTDALDDDFADELAADLELRTADYQRRGLPLEAARRQARRDLGGINGLRDAHRTTRSLAWLDHAWRDVRTSLRALRRTPVFTAFALITLTLGLGASATVYSLVHALLVRPLPFADPDRLVWIANVADDGVSEWRVQVNHLRDLQAAATTVDGLAGYYGFTKPGGAIITMHGRAERFTRQQITRDLLPLLGVAPMLGRNFSEAETTFGGPPAVILGFGLWTEHFAADPQIVGKTIVLDGLAVPVIGVLSAEFDFGAVFEPGRRVDLFTPYPLSDETNRSGNTVAVIGRLKPGVTVDAARAELRALATTLEREHPERNSLRPKVVPLAAHVTGQLRPALALLAGAVCVVMLIVCANLANLQLARASARRREWALRAALGASTWRLVAPAVIESLLLTAAGSVGGAVLAIAATRLLARVQAVPLPLMYTVRVDAATYLVVALAAAVVVVLIGAIPAWRAIRQDSQEGLRDGARGNTGGRRAALVRNGLVVSEVTLACLLLIGASLLLRSLLHVLDVQLGFRPEGAIAVRIDPDRQPPTRAGRNAYYDRIVSAVRDLDGVHAAGLTDVLPLDGNRSRGVSGRGQVYVKGRMPEGFVRVVTDGYIEALGLRVIAGRGFQTTDHDGGEAVALVNETLARALWPGQDAIGQFVMAEGPDQPRRIVGVVGDVRHRALERVGGAEVYLPMVQTDDYGSVYLLVRGDMPAGTLTARVRTRLAEVAPSLPTNDVRVMTALVERAVAPRRFVAWLLAGFAVFAAVLAALGIYAVVAYTTSQRRTEFGVRMALGATVQSVRRNVLWQAVHLAVIGVTIGAVSASALAVAGRDLLYGVAPTDAATFAMAAVALIAVATLAAYLPARAASRVEPLEALRSE